MRKTLTPAPIKHIHIYSTRTSPLLQRAIEQLIQALNAQHYGVSHSAHNTPCDLLINFTAHPLNGSMPQWLVHHRGHALDSPRLLAAGWFTGSKLCHLRCRNLSGYEARLTLAYARTPGATMAEILRQLPLWLASLVADTSSHTWMPARAFAPVPIKTPRYSLEFGWIRRLFTLVKQRIQRRKKKQIWRIASGHSPSPLTLPTQVHIHAQNTQVIADPFPLQSTSGTYVFVETAQHFDSRGGIGIVKPGEQCVHNILSTEHHLSYPWVGTVAEKLIMIPESGTQDALYYYYADRPEGPWLRGTALLQGDGWRDATPYWDGQRWWLWVCRVAGHENATPWLYLFSAKTLTSSHWRAHPESPISRDIRHARPAGRMINWQGRLFRVAQDGSRGYGYAVRLIEIQKLSAHDYQERPIRRIRAQDLHIEACGLHTWNWLDGQVWFDLRRWQKISEIYCAQAVPDAD